jgi:hypothetical protein
MELERKVEMLSPGRSAPAWSSLIQSLVAVVTILGTLLLAVFNGWFGAVISMMDKETGVLVGVSEEEITELMRTVGTPILWAAFGLFLIVAIVLTQAALKDAQRGVSRSWLRAFAEFEMQRGNTGDVSTTPDAHAEFWNRLSRAS